MTQRLKGVERAIEAFRGGDPVLIHDSDDREAETDLVYPAAAVTPEAVARLRNDAGGLVCVALSDAVAEAFDLPLLEEALDHPSAGGAVAYDDRSSFSISVNHRDTYTGITDEDRSRTVRALAAAADRVPEYGVAEFAGEFRSPGHVTLLRSAPTLADRRGHTELGIALAAAADREPAVVVCEMLDDVSGRALPKAAAREYATRHDLAFVEGAALIEALAP
jgi:3,4-dihydroxy 2-butanone 4-phosphate synthase